MAKGLNEALASVEKTYDELVVIANNLAQSYTAEIDDIIKKASNVKELTGEQLRNLILLLSIKSYSFSETKELAEFKAEISKTLRKTAYFEEFARVEGTQGIKESLATTKISYEILTESIYSLVSDLLKTKLDEVHRVVDALKSVLMSRMQELKLSMTNNSIKAAYED